MALQTCYVRSAADDDLKSVQTLLREAWHAAYDRIHGAANVAAITADWHSLSKLTANLKRPWSEFLVADTGETLAGMAYARRVQRTLRSFTSSMSRRT
jgi:hypothetical protein